VPGQSRRPLSARANSILLQNNPSSLLQNTPARELKVCRRQFSNPHLPPSRCPHRPSTVQDLRTHEAAAGASTSTDSLPIASRCAAASWPTHRMHRMREPATYPAIDSEVVLRSSHQKRIVVSDALRAAPAPNGFRSNDDSDSSKNSETSPLATGKLRAIVSPSSGCLARGLRSHEGAARERGLQFLFVKITSNWRRSSCLRRRA
jgi:hypothetical protein